jgi:prephenate dehydrogenase
MSKKILVLDRYTNGHQAALQFIRAMRWGKRECELVFCGSHESMLCQLSQAPSYAVVPVHNTVNNRIGEVLDRIGCYKDLGYEFEVVKKLDLEINHCLMALPHIGSATQLDRVFSKQQALGQCDRYLSKCGITADRRSETDSTGEAARLVSQKPKLNFGAIAPREAARVYGLRILAENIQDVNPNVTTFELLHNKVEVEKVVVGIIGIAGEFGRFLEHFFEGLGCVVIGSDPPALAGDNPMPNSDVVKAADVIIFSVDAKKTADVIRSLTKYSRKDQLWMDVTSVKQPAVEAMLRSRANVVGLHPMFAPKSGFDGETIVVCPARLDQPRWKTWLRNVLVHTRSALKWSTAREHDLYTVTTQGAPHSAILANAVLMAELGVSVKESTAFTTPFNRLMFASQCRFLHQNPATYAGIMMRNPNMVKMLETRISIEKKLIGILKRKDRAAFAELFEKAKNYFGPEVIRDGNLLFSRLVDVPKTVFSRNAITLEFDQLDNRSGLLFRVSAVFARHGVDILGFSSLNTEDGNKLQFTLRSRQPKTSKEVQAAFREFRRWKRPIVRVYD